MGNLFGTDGIRAKVGEQPLTSSGFLRIGKAVGQVLTQHDKNAAVVVGRDTRESGVMLQSAVTAGLLETGVDVIDAGVITTPGVAYLTRELSLSAGAVISASHNPVSENGIKFFGPGGRKVSADMENEIEGLLTDGSSWELAGTDQMGRCIDGQGLKELYIRNLLGEHPGLDLSGIPIVLDCANGAASHLAPEVFARMGAQVVAFYASPTGLNINAACGSEHVRRHPDDIRRLMERSQARFGLAFDGDADRVIVFDASGNMVDGDYMLGVLARYFDSRQQLMARSVVTTTMRNAGLKFFLDELGIQMFETPVGDKYVVEKMETLRQPDMDHTTFGLGGEQSGHIIILDDKHFTGDGMRTGLFVIQAFLAMQITSVSELAPELVKRPQLIASAYVGSGPRLGKDELESLAAQLRKDMPEIIRVNLRYSGTEPLFRIMLEADNCCTTDDLTHVARQVAQKGQSFAGLVDAPVDVLYCG